MRSLSLYLSIIYCLFPNISKCQEQGLAEMLWDSAVYFHEQKNYSQSVGYWDRYLIESPDSKHALFRKAVVLLDAMLFQEAIDTYDHITRISKEVDPRVYVNKGTAFLNLKKYDSSIVHFSIALQQTDFYDSIVYRQRAYAYSMMGLYQQSLNDLDMAAKYKPVDIPFYMMRATVTSYLNDHKRTLADVDFLLKKDAHNLGAKILRATALLGVGSNDRCIQLCNQELSRNPENLTFLFFRGQALMQQREFTLAVEDFNRCAKIDTQLPGYYTLKGMANYYLANDEEAIRDFTNALKNDAKNGLLYLLRGTCKNNLNSGTGCDDIQTAMALGYPDAKALWSEECK